MTLNKTIVKTASNRSIEVCEEANGHYVSLYVTDTLFNDTILSSLPKDKAKQVGKALIESAGGKFVGSIDTKATHSGGWITSGSFSYQDTFDPDRVQQSIDSLRAIRDKLTEVQKDEKDRKARRDRIAREVTEDPERTYSSASYIVKNAIDRIIKLEDDAK